MLFLIHFAHFSLDVISFMPLGRILFTPLWHSIITIITMNSFLYCLEKYHIVPYTIAFPQKSVLCQKSRKLIKALIVTKTTGNITFSITEDVGCLPKL